MRRKKRRLALVIAILTLIIIITVTSRLNIAKGKSPTTYNEIVVKNGDTLWSIARDHYYSNDIRKSVWELRKINNLKDANIRPGQIIRIPAE